ncbi:hypothetical protein AAE478_007560 [Parahypoxylon ruwenzoriense]
MNSVERKAPKRWTEEEDNILHNETQKQGSIKDWHRIAAKLPGRTNKDCRKRWVNKVCGSLKKGTWSDDEDERLLTAVDKHGQKWTLVANEVGFRSPDQCAKRWQSKLDPNLEHGAWTTEEDELLLSLVQEIGREWKTMQEQSFPRRSTNELKNRYTVVSRNAKSSFARAESLDSFSAPALSDSENPVVVEDVHTNPGNAKIDEVDNNKHPGHQAMTEDWVNMLSNTDVWIDQFSQTHSFDVGDPLSGAHPSGNETSMDIDGSNTQQGQDRSMTLIPPHNSIPTSNASGWTGLLYDTGITLSANENQMLLDSPQSDHILRHVLSDGTQGLESLEIDTREVDTVGTVSLVIDGCDRETLHHLLDLSRSLKGKSRIEIHRDH